MTVNTLFGPRDLVEEAVERLRGYAPLAGPDGYWLAFSGGKDSVAILELANLAGVKFEAHYNVTTIDPPEVVRFVRSTDGVQMDRPKHNFFDLLIKHGFPTRCRRWCCEKLKEGGGTGRMVVTGVRWAESARRSKRRLTETCYRGKGTRYLHPIIDWTDHDVWRFIRDRRLPYCKLYDAGYSRVGCIFCPMSAPWKKQLDAARYPRFAALFRRYFRRLFDDRERRGMGMSDRWLSGDDLFDWWLRNDPMPNPDDNGGLFE